MNVTEDSRATNRYHRWRQQNEEAGKPVPASHDMWRAFIAGWQARLDAALADFKVWGDDDTLIQDYVKGVQAQFDRVTADNWKMRSVLQQKQNIIDAWHMAKDEERKDKYAVRDGKVEERLANLPLWKRISMQRKELRALHHEIGWRDRSLQSKDAVIARLRAQIAELEKSDG